MTDNEPRVLGTAPLLRLGPHGPELLILGSLQAGAPRYEASDDARAAWAATKHMPQEKPEAQKRAA